MDSENVNDVAISAVLYETQPAMHEFPHKQGVQGKKSAHRKYIQTIHTVAGNK